MDEKKPEPRGFLCVLVSAFALMCGWSLSKLHAPTQDSSGSHHPQDSAHDAATPVHVIVDAFPPTPTPNKERESREERQEGRDKKRFRLEKIGAAVLFIYTLVTGFMWWATKKSADAAERAANWTQRQTQYLFDQQSPFVWVKMLDSIHVEVGKPITATVEVFNYGHSPVTVRAYGYVEAGPMVIEKLRDHPLGNVPESKGIRIILLAPGEGTKDFPIETMGKALTKDDLRLISNGAIDVVIYGHIDYTNQRNPGLRVSKYMSSFCFYRLKDGAVSVCPNYEHAYTNWAP
jgi:hypothetical protein